VVHVRELENLFPCTGRPAALCSLMEVLHVLSWDNSIRSTVDVELWAGGCLEARTLVISSYVLPQGKARGG